MNRDQKQVISLLHGLEYNAGPDRIRTVADYLGYTVGSDPVNPENEWKMLLHDEFDAAEQAVLAVLADDELTPRTPTREVRKRYEQVIQLDEGLGSSYNVPLAAFIGKGRIVLYRLNGGNRDERLDLSEESVEQVPLYAEHFNHRLIRDQLKLEENDFGFGYDIAGLSDLFKRSLSGRFQQMIELYRKKLSEAIAGSELRQILKPLLSEKGTRALKMKQIPILIEDPSFKSAIGCVVDTVILRQLLLRFLEGYYGAGSFNVNGVALGVAAGTLETALQEAVQVYRPDYDDRTLNQALKKRGTIAEQLTMDDLFGVEETAVTASVTFEQDGEEKIIELYDRIRKQFEVTYGGDLFAGSVGKVADEMEHALTEAFPELMAKLWADTSTDQYSFRYEDLPPELLEQQYEASMSRTVQIRLQEGIPSIFYGDDRRGQKEKGAYYTDSSLVTYMVKQSVEPAFDARLENIREAVKSGNEADIRDALDHLLSLKVIDPTCGGGSFLRGVFHYLAERHHALARLAIPESLRSHYPMLHESDAGRNAWERHLMLNVLYGIDIDYKALIICSQTLTLSALRHWQMGEEFPELIGRTLIHQNALISPVPFEERAAAYQPYAQEISELIKLRTAAAYGDKAAGTQAEQLRLSLQQDFKKGAREQFGESADQLQVESLELNVPEVFFGEEGEWKENAGFDVTIGNPPWEIWKPNAEEFFEPYDDAYRNAGKQQKLKLEQKLFAEHPILKEKWEATKKMYEAGSRYFLDPKFYQFQKWRVNGRFTGSDINLYKISLERFYQLLKIGGHLSILVPGNIATDQGATGLRYMLLEEISLNELLSFENKLGIFEAIHRSYKIALVAAEKKTPDAGHSFTTFFYRHKLEDLWNDNGKIVYLKRLAERAAPDTLSLLEIRDNIELDILEKVYQEDIPLLKDGVWNTTWGSEFHMTSDSGSFLGYDKSLGNLPLYEGKTIGQYSANGPIKYSVAREVAYQKFKRREYNKIVEKLVSSGYEPRQLDDIELTMSYEMYRIAFREVSSSTNKRTLISTMLPKETVAGNTLVTLSPTSIQANGHNYNYVYSVPLKRQLVLVGLLNSFVLDFIIRRKVGTHVNIFYLNQLPIINIQDTHKYFFNIMSRVAHLICTSVNYDELAKEAGMSDYKQGVTDSELRQTLQNQIDAYVADLYGLTREELIYILSTFESPKHKAEMRKIGQSVIEAFDELKREGELHWPVK